MNKVLKVDLNKMSEEERGQYYIDVCEELGLNPKLKPFAFLEANSGIMMYALRSATDQLRFMHNLSSKIVKKEVIANRVYEVTAQVSDGKRSEESIGAVSVVDKNGQPLKSNDLVNAIMSAGTKAIRRATLAFCGLSFLDESERDSFENEDLGVPNTVERYSPEKPSREEQNQLQLEVLENLEIVDIELKEGSKKPFYKLTFRDNNGAFCHVMAINEMMDYIDNMRITQGYRVTIQKFVKNNNDILRGIKVVS